MDEINFQLIVQGLLKVAPGVFELGRSRVSLPSGLVERRYLVEFVLQFCLCFEQLQVHTGNQFVEPLA